uniref:DUF2147 domain-containing protein n=1 Tax=Flavobacterium sp. TaxID=239 RepID=UPI003753334B
MNSKIIICVLLFFQISFSQTVIGRWKTIDDETGKEKGVVEIYEKNGKIYGKIVEILDAQHRDKKCTLCKGDDKNKPILGLTFIKGLTKDGDEYNDGQVLDPKNGKLYKCYITLIGNDKLKIRGYIGI